MNDWGTLARVRHLNCGTFRARAGGPPLVSHVLVCEFEHGVVLVDSGLGVDDVTGPSSRLGHGFRLLLPALDRGEPAVAQLDTLGYQTGDVTDILLTHLDLDHVGGAVDFPTATVRTTSTELTSAVARADVAARMRYRPPHIASVEQRVTTYGEPTGDLFGFAAHRLHDSVWAVPLPGHTAGHCAIAVRDPRRGWLLHAGDAFHHRRAITGQRSGKTIDVVESMLAESREQLRSNQRRLADLASQQSGPEIFCAHDPVQFRAFIDD